MKQGSLPVVLVHGWGMSNAVWDELAALLPGRQVIRLALPGHAGANSGEVAADLGAWAQHLLAQAPERALWVGWSLGGLVALRAALDHPRRIAGLQLLGVSPRFTRETGWSAAVDPAVLDEFASALEQDPRLLLQRFCALQVMGDARQRRLRHWLGRQLNGGAIPDRVALQAGLRLLAATDLRDAIADLRPPSCWMWGAVDPLAPAVLADWLRPQLPDACLQVLPATAHLIPLAKPALVAAALEQLGDRVDG